MRLYMVRHGESYANLNRIVSLPTVQLTEKGVSDAVKAGELLKNVKPDVVFVSPYARAMQTMQNAMPNCEYTVVDCLREIDCGSLEGRAWRDIGEEIGERLDKILEVDDFSEFGGETYADLQERTRVFRKMLEQSDSKTVVAFSHAGFICTMYEDIIDRHGKPGRNYDLDNGSVSVFELRAGKWFCCALNLTQKYLR